MGARWAWTAVCPNLHVYSNFSGGADACYTCGAEPEVEFEGNNAGAEAAQYVYQRHELGLTPEEIDTAGEIVQMLALAEKHGYEVTKV